MNKLFSKIAALSVGLAMAVGVGVAVGHESVKEVRAEDVSDVITVDDTSATTTTYVETTGIKKNTAVYTSQNAHANAANGNGLQYRSNNNNSGIISTTSGGIIKSVTVEYASGKSGDFNVYASNTAYTSIGQLYSSASSIGTISSTSTTYTFEDEYEYVGLRSSSGARYILSITFVWGEKSETDPSIRIDQESKEYEVGDHDTLTVTTEHAEGYTVEWSSSDASVMSVDNSGNVEVKAIGASTITASLVKDSVVAKKSSVVMTVTGTLTADEAVTLATSLGSGVTSAYKVTVVGVISTVTGGGTKDTNNFVWLSGASATKAFEIYFGYVAVAGWSEFAVTGNEVSAYGYLMNFKGTTMEMTSPSNLTVIRTVYEIEADEFVADYMHLTDYTEELGYCKDEEHGYYAKAKAAFNGLSSEARSLLTSESKYEAAMARLNAWAAANGDVIDSSNTLVEGANYNSIETSNNAYIIIIAIASFSVLSFGLALALRKKRTK